MVDFLLPCLIAGGELHLNMEKYRCQQVEFSSACPHNHRSLLCKFVMGWCRPFLISVLETLGESYGMFWCGTLKSSVFECCFNKLPAGFPLEVTFCCCFFEVFHKTKPNLGPFGHWLGYMTPIPSIVRMCHRCWFNDSLEKQGCWNIPFDHQLG